MAPSHEEYMEENNFGCVLPRTIDYHCVTYGQPTLRGGGVRPLRPLTNPPLVRPSEGFLAEK
jgi:hypothetical protein